VKVLNELPEHGFSLTAGQPSRVRVIGWGQWAAFFQRHLCSAVQHDFNMYERKWGVHDEARQFAAGSDKLFTDLRLYPFVRISDSMNESDYRNALDIAALVTKSAPELIPGQCWNELWTRVPFAAVYQPLPYDQLGEWFTHDPPPGTAYDSHSRMDHGNILQSPNVADQLARIHQMAPYDHYVTYAISSEVYKGKMTYSQVTNLDGSFLAYDASANESVADTVTDKPDEYIKWMSKAAALEPAYYFTLGDYERDHNLEDQAAAHYEKGQALEINSLVSAMSAEWRIKYYLKKGDQKKARAVADAAGDVYSASGLQAKASFFEATRDYANAFEWYAKVEERYNESEPLISFCNRYKASTGDTRFDAEMDKRRLEKFPQGIEKVTLQNFNAAPVDGVLIREENDLLRQAGLKTGDVIVALNGIHMHNYIQYNYTRQTLTKPAMTLIVWHGGHYLEVTTSPPNHRFSVDMDDYVGE
jgi:hypothetical protein